MLCERAVSYQRPGLLPHRSIVGPLVSHWFRAQPPHQPCAHTSQPCGLLVSKAAAGGATIDPA